MEFDVGWRPGRMALAAETGDQSSEYANSQSFVEGCQALSKTYLLKPMTPWHCRRNVLGDEVNLNTGRISFASEMPMVIESRYKSFDGLI